MKEELAERFSLKHTDLRMVDSETLHLQYIFDNDGTGMVISGLFGMTGLTLEQAKSIAKELPQILDVFFNMDT